FKELCVLVEDNRLVCVHSLNTIKGVVSKNSIVVAVYYDTGYPYSFREYDMDRLISWIYNISEKRVRSEYFKVVTFPVMDYDIHYVLYKIRWMHANLDNLYCIHSNNLRINEVSKDVERDFQRAFDFEDEELGDGTFNLVVENFFFDGNKWNCELCGAIVKDHRHHYRHKHDIRKCEDCPFVGNKQNMVKHLINEHDDKRSPVEIKQSVDVFFKTTSRHIELL
ncbi:putative: hypothetical protein, partial [Candida maltosa Xu316]